MNAPEEDPASDREKKDWITFFKRGHRMTESQVQEQIQTPEVLQAFERAKFSSMPRGVKEDYDDEDSQYDRYSQHTAAEVAKGEAMGEKKGLLKAARAMKKRGKMTDTEIAADLGLAESDVSEIKVDDQES
jgi:transcription initiation factor IIE alpha subunit